MVVDIEDDVDNVIDIVDNVQDNEEDVIVDDADDIIDVNFEDVMDDEDEESVISEDSNYASDYSEEFNDTLEKHLTHAEVNAITGRTKHCAIYFYYTTGGTYSACAECIMRIADTDFQIMHAFRKHVTDAFGRLDSKYCSNCRQPMFVLIPCNMCPVCTQ